MLPQCGGWWQKIRLQCHQVTAQVCLLFLPFFFPRFNLSYVISSEGMVVFIEPLQSGTQCLTSQRSVMAPLLWRSPTMASHNLGSRDTFEVHNTSPFLGTIFVRLVCLYGFLNANWGMIDLGLYLFYSESKYLKKKKKVLALSVVTWRIMEIN